MVVLWNINQRSSAKSADAASSVWPSTVMRTTFVLWADREDWAHAKVSGERTSDRNKDCTSSARFISSTLLARRVKLSGIFTNKSAFWIKSRPLGPLGPQDWRKIVRVKSKSEQTGFPAAGWIGSEVAPGHTFRLLRGRFYSVLIFKCLSCCLVIRVPNNRTF